MVADELCLWNMSNSGKTKALCDGAATAHVLVPELLHSRVLDQVGGACRCKIVQLNIIGAVSTFTGCLGCCREVEGCHTGHNYMPGIGTVAATNPEGCGHQTLCTDFSLGPRWLSHTIVPTTLCPAQPLPPPPPPTTTHTHTPEVPISCSRVRTVLSAPTVIWVSADP
jgi:hypothetical protein